MASATVKKLATVIWGDWQTNELWQRLLKHIIALTIAFIVAILPWSINTLGLNTFLVPMSIVFAHPAQRMGLMIESMLMELLGSLLGLSWSILGLWLSSLLFDSNQPAAYSVRAVFLLVAVFVHGMIRSSSPRLFVFVWLMLFSTFLTLLGKSNEVNKAVFTSVYYPLLLGNAILIPVNLLVFPELSSSFLGASTINSLTEAMDTLNRASYWFVTPGGDTSQLAGEQETLHTAVIGNVNSNASASREKNTAAAAQKRTKSKKKKKGFWRKFSSEFPNPFKTSKGPNESWLAPLSSTTLANLTARKAKLRAQLGRCKAAQEEVNFEISISPLPPIAMRPISTQCMTSFVQNTIALIGACENKFLVLDSLARPDTRTSLVHEPINTNRPPHQTNKDAQVPKNLAAALLDFVPGAKNGKQSGSKTKPNVDLVKPIREMGSGDAELLESIIARVRGPVLDFQKCLQEAVVLLTSCLAYSFDVSRLPSGAPAPKGISLEELDLRLDSFTDAIALFDRRTAEELRKSAMDETGQKLDMMPRMETFLISSFILGFRQAAEYLLEMLRHARDIVEKRRARHDKSRLWLPHYTNVRQWLLSGGEKDGMAQPEAAWRSVREENDLSTAPPGGDKEFTSSGDSSPRGIPDEEALTQANSPNKTQRAVNGAGHKKPKPRKRSKRDKGGWITKIRSGLDKSLNAVMTSEDLSYSTKLAVAIFLVSWPSFVMSWHAWYASVRGVWAPLQLVLVFEVAIGASLFTFAIRLVGVAYGCLMGYAAYEIGQGHRPAIVVVMVLAVIPSAYVQLATKYVKAGMISIVSLSVVTLAAVNKSGTALESFYKRLSAFLIGGMVAMLVEVLIYPVRARDRLVESLSTSVSRIEEMQAAVAIGIDGPEMPNFRSKKLQARFNRARNKAQAALAAAETFLPFCLTEPRLKGSFKALAPIYREIIYVLHQIIDRMDNVVQLRRAYGSSILEDLNPQVYAYRRNASAGITLMLFSVDEALTTWLPLPQFIPSARLAQLRLVNRVREVVAERNSHGPSVNGLPASLVDEDELDKQTAQVLTQHKFLSWNANAAGQMEIVEYLEELIELVKLLVGVNAFRSGVLEKPSFKEYAQKVKSSEQGLEQIRSGRTATSSAPTAEDEDAARVRSRGSSRPSFFSAVSTAQQVEKLRLRMKKSGSNTATDGAGNASGEQTDSHVHGGQEQDNRGNAYHDNETEEEEDEEEVDHIPRSLQRVGTRIWQENAAVRRRGFSLDG